MTRTLMANGLLSLQKVSSVSGACPGTVPPGTGASETARMEIYDFLRYRAHLYSVNGHRTDATKDPVIRPLNDVKKEV